VPIRVEVREGESLSSALQRFRRQVHAAYRRPWTKRKLGYYEKPSVLRRKKKRMKRMNMTSITYAVMFGDRHWEPLRLYVGLAQQLRRSGTLGAGK
jgi:ribosomal protein S21